MLNNVMKMAFCINLKNSDSEMKNTPEMCK